MKWWQRGWSELAAERTKAVRLKVKPFGVPYGIEVLKVFLLFEGLVGTLLTLLSLNPWIHSVHSVYLTYLMPHDRMAQVVGIIESFFCLAWFYALHRRLPIAWTVGWVVISGSFLVVGVGSARSVFGQETGLGRWVAACIVGVAVLAVAVCLGMLWKDQRYFFRGKDS